jgi:hypothetical protein
MTSSGPSPEYRAFVEAGIGILMATIQADGKFSADEFAWWKTVQHRHPLFRDVPGEAFNPMLHRVKAQLASQPWKTLVEGWAAAIPEQYRTSMFELAAELAVVDKELEGKEPEVLRHLWKALGIPDDTARRLCMSKIERM